MNNESLKKVGEIAELLGITPRTLRFYEEEGLISACRSPGGTRLYNDEDILRFRAIIRLAHSGIPINLIKKLATTRSKTAIGAESSRQVNELLQQLASQVKEQIEVLTVLIADLSTAAATVQHCFDCTNPPTRKGCPTCPINQQVKTSEILNLIWEQHSCPDQE